MYSPASLTLVNRLESSRSRPLQGIQLSKTKEPHVNVKTSNARIFPSLNPFSRPSHDRIELLPFCTNQTPKLSHYKPIKTSNTQIFPSLHPFSTLYREKIHANSNPAFQTPKLAASPANKAKQRQESSEQYPLSHLSFGKSQLGPRPAFPTPKLADPDPTKKIKRNDRSEIINKPQGSLIQAEKDKEIKNFMLEFEEFVFSKKPVIKRQRRPKSQIFEAQESFDILELPHELASEALEPLVIPDALLMELAKLRRQKEVNEKKIDSEEGFDNKDFVKKEEWCSSDETEEGFDCKMLIKKEEWHNSNDSQSSYNEVTLNRLLTQDGLFFKSEEDLRHSDILSLLKKEIDPVNVKKESLKQEM